MQDVFLVDNYWLLHLFIFFDVIAFISEKTKHHLTWLSMADHDRPLSKAGRAAAISVSNKLQQMGWIPELVLCR